MLDIPQQHGISACIAEFNIISINSIKEDRQRTLKSCLTRDIEAYNQWMMSTFGALKLEWRMFDCKQWKYEITKKKKNFK